MQSKGTLLKAFVKYFLKINKDDMQLEVTLMIGYKCGAENTGESSLLPHTVGYVHSEYLSCTTPPQGFTAQEVSLGTTHNHVVPFAYFSKSSTIDLLSFYFENE